MSGLSRNVDFMSTTTTEGSVFVLLGPSYYQSNLTPSAVDCLYKPAIG